MRVRPLNELGPMAMTTYSPTPSRTFPPETRKQSFLKPFSLSSFPSRSARHSSYETFLMASDSPVAPDSSHRTP
jgi:hypothetical protein